jgi:hypothetical protein
MKIVHTCNRGCAVLQAECLTKLEQDWLSDGERDVVRWAMNARWVKPARSAKSGLSLLDYKRASAMEVLVRFSYFDLDGCIAKSRVAAMELHRVTPVLRACAHFCKEKAHRGPRFTPKGLRPQHPERNYMPAQAKLPFDVLCALAVLLLSCSVSACPFGYLRARNLP